MEFLSFHCISVKCSRGMISGDGKGITKASLFLFSLFSFILIILSILSKTITRERLRCLFPLFFFSPFSAILPHTGTSLSGVPRSFSTCSIWANC